jgi:hypothetical protein
MESTMNDALGWVQKNIFMAYPSIFLGELRKVVKIYQVARQGMKCRILNKGNPIHDV